MKGLFIRIDPTLDRELTELCRHEGYKKSGVIQKLIRDFLQRKRSSQDSVRAAAEFGIDTTLLSQNLQKTPTERLRDHEQFHTFVSEVRSQGRKK